jgi:hypothetical protein
LPLGTWKAKNAGEIVEVFSNMETAVLYRQQG